MYYSPKTSTDGLVFHYDTGNTVRSYLGEPTTNVVSTNGQNFNPLDLYTWASSGNTSTWSRDTTAEKSPVGGIPLKEVSSGTDSYSSTYNNLTNSLGTASAGQTWTVSVYAKAAAGTNLQLWLFEANSSGGYVAISADSFTATGNWQRLVITRTLTDGTTAAVQARVATSTNGGIIWWDGLQMEQKSKATQFTTGTRSATQGLKDLTAKNTIDLTNVSFDSNAQMTFDGSNDYISLADGTKWFTNEWTYEMVLKFNGNTGTYQGLLWGEGDTGGGSGLQKLFSFYNYSYFHYRIHNAVTGWAQTDFTPTGYTPTKYNHLVWQFNNGVTNLYINGTLAHTNNVRGAYNGGTNSPLYVGSRNDLAYVFNGELPVLKRYSRALTADEVQRNFNAVKSRFNIA